MWQQWLDHLDRYKTEGRMKQTDRNKIIVLAGIGLVILAIVAASIIVPLLSKPDVPETASPDGCLTLYSIPNAVDMASILISEFDDEALDLLKSMPFSSTYLIRDDDLYIFIQFAPDLAFEVRIICAARDPSAPGYLKPLFGDVQVIEDVEEYWSE